MLAILTVNDGKIVAAVDESGKLPAANDDAEAAMVLEGITCVALYDPKTGLGWLLINKVEEDFVVLIPEAVKLAEPYKWVDLSDEQSKLEEQTELILMKIVRSL